MEYGGIENLMLRKEGQPEKGGCGGKTKDKGVGDGGGRLGKQGVVPRKKARGG